MTRRWGCALPPVKGFRDGEGCRKRKAVLTAERQESRAANVDAELVQQRVWLAEVPGLGRDPEAIMSTRGIPIPGTWGSGSHTENPGRLRLKRQHDR